MVWSHHTQIPYAHHLIVRLAGIPYYCPPTPATKAVPAKKATATTPAVPAKPKVRTTTATVKQELTIRNASYPLPLLGVNHEARTEVLRHNPNFLEINARGPRIYFNAARNIIHLDFYSLHVLSTYANEFGAGPTVPDPYPALTGFSHIESISVPPPRPDAGIPALPAGFSGTHKVVLNLRQVKVQGPGAGAGNATLASALRHQNPPLSGVSYVESTSAASSGFPRTRATRTQCVLETRRLYGELKRRWRRGAQRKVVDFACSAENREVNEYEFQPVDWTHWSVSKGPGVRGAFTPP